MKALKLFWKWSWLVTFPVVCVFLYWGWVTAERFFTFGVHYNPEPIQYHLHETGEKEFYSLIRKTELAVRDPWGKQNKKPGDLKVINLFVPESNLAKLNSNLPHSGYQYVKGGILNGGKLNKMKIRYRGDFVYHWGDEKKSLRVKTSKQKLFNGVRKFNLIGTKQLETHFGILLAREMGLMAPRTDLVEVTLNGKLLGTHVYVEQLEELTIRDNGRMPGDLYAGELMAKDSYRGVEPQIFNYPQLWEKVAINNHYDEESRRPLERLLALINDPDTVRAQRELTELLDVQAWGLMAAFETLTQSYHYDNAHNWRLYYDPMKSRFIPVIWDPLGWPPFWVPKKNTKAQLDVMPSIMHQFLFKNADILRARAQALEEFFKYGKDKAFLQKIDQVLPGLERATRRDPLITQSPEAALEGIDSFRSSVNKVFTDIKQGYLENKGPVKYAVRLEGSSDLIISLSVSGRVPVSKLRLLFANTIDRPITGSIAYNVNREGIEKDISGAISLSGSKVEIAKALISRHLQIEVGNNPLKKRRLQIEPANYELRLNGVNSSNQLVDVLVDYGDGEISLAGHVSVLEETPFVDLYNIVDSQPVELPIVWQGVVDVFDVTEIHRPLIIEPGTVIRFSPGASLILRGRLLAEGTAERPIRFIPMDDGQEPWGTFTLKGNKANGSRLKYCDISGGSGLKGDLFEYTAMFSIHDVKGVEVENCLFHDSKITDDMVHSVYSEVRFSNCLFERSLFDALDIDISEAVVDNCHFVDSGNDAIDLMTSRVVVVDTIAEGSSDKAVSVGEGSHLLAINNLFKENGIAVQVKDGSVATLYNVDLSSNIHALDAYKKNWRYNDGGEIFVYKGRFEKNKKMITADKKSKIRVFDSYMDRVVASTKRVTIDKTVDRLEPQQPHSKKLLRHQKEVKSMKEFNSRYWDRVDAGRRGALNVANH